MTKINFRRIFNKSHQLLRILYPKSRVNKIYKVDGLLNSVMVSYTKKISIVFIVIFTIFLLASYFIPIGKTLPNANLFIVPITLFFAIISGFSMARAWSEYSSMRDAVSGEVTAIANAWFAFSFFNKKELSKLSDLLKKYLEAVLKTDEKSFYKTNKEFDELRKGIHSVVKRSNKSIFIPIVLNLMATWERYRHDQILLSTSKLPKSLWILLGLLALIIIVYSFGVRVNSPVSVIVTTISSIAPIITIYIIYDLDRYDFIDNRMFVESTLHIFDIMGIKQPSLKEINLS